MQELRDSKVVGEFLKGVDYPISKADLVSASRDAKLGAAIDGALKKLPDRDYEDVEDVTQALNAGS